MTPIISQIEIYTLNTSQLTNFCKSIVGVDTIVSATSEMDRGEGVAGGASYMLELLSTILIISSASANFSIIRLLLSITIIWRI